MRGRTPSRLIAFFAALAACVTLGACGGGGSTVSTKLVSDAVSTTSNGGAFRIAISGSGMPSEMRYFVCATLG